MIKGTTKIFGVIGFPIEHTASPAIHNAAFAALGLDCAYLPLAVRPENLGRAVAGLSSLGIIGLNVTIPHKETVIACLDEVSEEARRIGAVNTVAIRSGKLIGYNTDGKGFVQALKEEGKIDIQGRRIVILGAGGAGRAVAVQSGLEGAGELIIFDKIAPRAKRLAADIGRNIPQLRVGVISWDKIKFNVGKADILINATPVGMNAGDKLLIDPEWLLPRTLVFDLVYNPQETRLMQASRERGCSVVGGLGMLIHQGALSFELWTGKEAPLDAMRKAAEEVINSQQSTVNSRER
ncbi:shikimate dehydrogenase [candidate division NPL-UPA2 bacterium Unc8]|uniref:Shikimate dehydrogenase (NADP(+)) n=1 Tax=candidate division NPL-UPA2 bacterium Unc8 TaxID=1980939 RepID=A0A399FXE0_UNCN2|nr:Shikimate dehydrogenase (NADP(+)) [Bacillota bacterium]MBT9146879.1 Shikimate dehydrogenase (NADP(+)) [Bacillota bacterium]RII01065.1 MAG: shikimate dehydrogenase [candidate division NPL-UPA2 bacterium Unc8]